MWKKDIFQNLRKRDATERYPFKDLVRDYQELSVTCLKQAGRILQLEKETSDYLKRRLVPETLVSGRPDEAAIFATRKDPDLEETIASLRSELANVYRTHGLNAQKLLDLNEKLTKQETLLDLKEHECRDYMKENEIIKERSEQQSTVVQVLQDEMRALQLELLKMEVQLKELQEENKRLLQGWLLKVDEVAVKMNEELTSSQSSIDKKMSTDFSRSSSSLISGESENLRTPVDSVIPSKIRQIITSHESEINDIQFSNNSSLFITAANDKIGRLFETHSVSPKGLLFGAMQAIMGVDFDIHDQNVVGACNDNAVYVWSVPSHRLLHTFTGHSSKVFSARFCNSLSQRIVSGSHDRTVKIWDLVKDYCIRTIMCVSACNDVCPSDMGGNTIASGHLDGKLRLWDARTGNSIKIYDTIHKGQITCVTTSLDNSYLLTNSRDNTLQVIDLRASKIISTCSDENYRVPTNWSQACFGLGGSLVASGSLNGDVYIWNAFDGTVNKILKSHQNYVSALTWNKNGHFILSADRSGKIVFWE